MKINPNNYHLFIDEEGKKGSSKPKKMKKESKEMNKKKTKFKKTNKMTWD